MYNGWNVIMHFVVSKGEMYCPRTHRFVEDVPLQEKNQHLAFSKFPDQSQNESYDKWSLQLYERLKGVLLQVDAPKLRFIAMHYICHHAFACTDTSARLRTNQDCWDRGYSALDILATQIRDNVRKTLARRLKKFHQIRWLSFDQTIFAVVADLRSNAEDTSTTGE